MARIFLLIVMVLFNANNSFAEENYPSDFIQDRWQKKDKGVYETSITSVVITSSGKLLASTDKAIYVSNNNGNSWQRITFLPKSKAKINDIACVDGDYLKIYIATTDGLYQIINQAGSAERIFKAWGENKKYVNCIEIDDAKNEKLYIGTKAGLFTSSDKGRHWKHVEYFKDKEINDIAFLDRDIFIAASDGIYKSAELFDNWIRTFVTAAGETEEVENNNNEDNNNEDEIFKNRINCLTADIDTKTLYAGIDKRMFISRDGGISWQGPDDDDIVASVPYHTESLAFNKNNKCIYAATNNGLYKYAFADEKKNEINIKDAFADFVKRQIKNEPGIQQIQKAAIEYAEVSPDKIKKMRYAAENKAWLPKVTVGFDYDADDNINIDRGSTTDPDVFIVGPNNESLGWGVSLNWDLGELIWNEDQTSIDVRSKLMVQLRDDILTEVTTLYFERRRLQLDIVNGKYKTRAQEVAMLRLQELTARIDALTGGFLSKGRSYE